MGQVEFIRGLFAGRGHDAYLGEPVSQAEHALQAAYFADRDNASDALIVAALLHDVGHLLHDLGDYVADRGVDAHHEVVGSGWLTSHFGSEVSEPARLHVDAKRFLCAEEPQYLEGLSAASKQSLILQGGPMSQGERDQFRANPHHLDAVRLRRWDDMAKIPGFEVPGLESYVERIGAMLRKPDLA